MQVGNSGNNSISGENFSPVKAKSSTDKILCSLLSRLPEKCIGQTQAIASEVEERFKKCRKKTKHLSSGSQIARIRRKCTEALSRFSPVLSNSLTIHCKDGSVQFPDYLKRALAVDSPFFHGFFYRRFMERDRKHYDLPDCTKADLEYLIESYTDENFVRDTGRTFELIRTMNALLLYPPAIANSIAEEIEKWNPVFPKDRETGFRFLKEFDDFALPDNCRAALQHFFLRAIQEAPWKNRCDYVDALHLLPFLERYGMNDESTQAFIAFCNRGFLNPFLNPAVGCGNALVEELKSLEYVKCFKVKDRPVTIDTLKEISNYHIRLEELSFENVDITDGIIRFLSSFPKLARLKCKNCRGIRDDSIDLILAHCPGLIGLDLSRSAELTDAAIDKISAFAHLRELYLSDCSGFTSAASDYLSYLVDLTLLDISRSDWLTDKGAEAISRMFNLRELRVAGCENLTNEAMKFFFSLSNLTVLDLSNSLWLTRPGLIYFFRFRLQSYTLRKVSLAHEDGFTPQLKLVIERIYSGDR